MKKPCTNCPIEEGSGQCMDCIHDPWNRTIFYYLKNMWPFKKKEKKPECEHEWETIKEYRVNHKYLGDLINVSIHYIQECKKCHELRERIFNMAE